jgi:predicted transcriptional regulator
MSALSIRLPESLHERVRELAAREGVSINQLIAAALAEKMSAIMTADHLEARARRGTREKFLAALAQVPDVEPEPQDRLPVETSRKPMQRSRASSGSTRTRRHPRASRLR